MIPSSVPKELQGVTQIEEMLIARALSIMPESFYKTWTTKRLFWALYQISSRC